MKNSTKGRQIVRDENSQNKQNKLGDLKNLTDRELYDLCQKYGKNALMWRRKFIALLPEVTKRELHKNHGFYSIFEFAAKLGGVTKKTVKEVLRTYQKVEDKPLLKAEIEKGGWGKVRAVTPLIESSKEEDLVEMVKALPKNTIEVAVREIRNQQKRKSAPPRLNLEAKSAPPRLNLEAKGAPFMWQNERVQNERVQNECVQNERVQNERVQNERVNEEVPPGWQVEEVSEETGIVTIRFKIDSDTDFRLRMFQMKLEKERKEKVSFGEVLKLLLDEVEKKEITKQIISAGF